MGLERREPAPNAIWAGGPCSVTDLARRAVGAFLLATFALLAFAPGAKRNYAPRSAPNSQSDKYSCDGMASAERTIRAAAPPPAPTKLRVMSTAQENQDVLAWNAPTNVDSGSTSYQLQSSQVTEVEWESLIETGWTAPSIKAQKASWSAVLLARQGRQCRTHGHPVQRDYGGRARLGQAQRVLATTTDLAVSVGGPGNSATEGTDYQTVADPTVTILAGTRSGTTVIFTITPTDDTEGEANETTTVSDMAARSRVPSATPLVDDGASASDNADLTADPATFSRMTQNRSRAQRVTVRAARDDGGTWSSRCLSIAAERVNEGGGMVDVELCIRAPNRIGSAQFEGWLREEDLVLSRHRPRTREERSRISLTSREWGLRTALITAVGASSRAASRSRLPNLHREAITSRPLVSHGIGRQIHLAGKTG